MEEETLQEARWRIISYIWAGHTSFKTITELDWFIMAFKETF